MSRGFKIFWAVIALLFVLGVVLAAVGFALGATGNAWYDRRGLHFGINESRTLELVEATTEPFEKVEIRLIDADVEFIVAEDYGYEFTYVGTREPSIAVKNGTLEVVEQEGNWRWNIMGFWTLFETTALLKVYVPHDAVLENVNLTTASGNTLLNSDAIRINNLDCKSASGNFDLMGVDLKTLSLDIASGDVRLENVSANRATINLLSGGFT
ncbi:MAG: DUF4097 domain-containing protein, partial [Coriobacteriales bacterium]|nr:DUF4097 domain-containing protein [Coriobacteriales bacterium]